MSTPTTLRPPRPRRLAFKLFVLLGVVLVVQAVWTPVVLQLSGSVERGVWVRLPRAVTVGDHVFFAAPESVRDTLTDHGYPADTRLFKPVMAGPGAVVTTTDGECRVDGVVGGEMDRVTSQGHALPRVEFDGELAPGQWWVLSEKPASVDSRCFGPLSESEAKGPYVLLWSWGR